MKALQGFFIVIFLFSILLHPVWAYSPELETSLTNYIDQFNIVTGDYVSGTKSAEEVYCEWAGVNFLLSYQFLKTPLNEEERLNLIGYLEEKYERGFYGDETQRDSKLMELQEDDDIVVTYHSEEARRSIIVYLDMSPNYAGTSPLLGGTKDSPAPPRPPPDMIRTYPDVHQLLPTSIPRAEYDACRNAVARPVAEDEINSAKAEIKRGQGIGIATTNSEDDLKEAIVLFESEEYLKAIGYARRSKDTSKSEILLKEYELMTEEEKERYALDYFDLSNLPTGVKVKDLDEEEFEIFKNLGVNNFQFAFRTENNLIYSETMVMDLENKKTTIYRNDLHGEPDLYVGVDLTFLVEFALFEDTRESNMFKLGFRVGRAIIRGDIKIKPIWKFYKMLSALEAIGESTSDFSEGVKKSLEEEANKKI